MSADSLAPPAVVVGTWRRRTADTNETIRLVRVGAAWQVHRTGWPPRTGLNQAQAYLAVARIVGDCWVYYPPPRRHRGRITR